MVISKEYFKKQRLVQIHEVEENTRRALSPKTEDLHPFEGKSLASKDKQRSIFNLQQFRTLKTINGLNKRENRNSSKQSLSLLSLLGGILESTVDGIIALSYSGEIVSFNQKLLEIWEIPNYSIVLKNSNCFFNFCRSQIKAENKIDRSRN
jgi:PAS domain-containing protein